MQKGVSKVNGVSNVEVTTSGRPLNISGLSGGAIFGVIFAVCVAGVFGNFVYKVCLSFVLIFSDDHLFMLLKFWSSESEPDF